MGNLSELNAVEKNLNKLKEKGRLRRVGPDKGGQQEVLKGAGLQARLKKEE